MGAFEEIDGALEGFDFLGFVGIGGGFDDEGLGEADTGLGFDGGDFDGALEVEDGLDEVLGGTFGLVVVGEEEEGFAIERIGFDDLFEDGDGLVSRLQGGGDAAADFEGLEVISLGHLGEMFFDGVEELLGLGVGGALGEHFSRAERGFGGGWGVFGGQGTDVGLAGERVNGFGEVDVCQGGVVLGGGGVHHRESLEILGGLHGLLIGEVGEGLHGPEELFLGLLFEQFIEEGDGLGGLLLGEKSLGEACFPVERFRPEHDGIAVSGLSAEGIAILEVAVGEHAEELLVGLAEGEGLGDVGDGFLGLVEAGVEHAQVGVGAEEVVEFGDSFQHPVAGFFDLTLLEIDHAEFVFEASGAFGGDELLVGADAGVGIFRKEGLDLGEVILLFFADFGFDVGLDAEGAEKRVPKLFGFEVVGGVERTLVSG